MRDVFRQIKEDWVAHGKDWTKPGFRALAIHRYGNWRQSIGNRFVKAPFSIVYRFMFRFARNRYGIELPFQVVIGRRVVFEHQHGIVVHGSAVIGDDCVIRQGVTIGNRNLGVSEAPRIGNRVNIGAGAKIIGNVVIGDDCNIGANAVVLKDVPNGSTAVGIPAKIIGQTQTRGTER
ncbi:serine O-acetyltransferase [Rhodopirellula europaea]|uniref:Serine acetyltransferase n=1 Tax=Rhodopirellula europaea SH398 TaxID=1263868 RepID=M5RZW6_9BACT|nr:serine O-acetyltransferase [Rhodopirellula europaea]EMI24756.1 serine O-acetyltransferase [Rhodopirellula europaea SH398]